MPNLVAVPAFPDMLVASLVAAIEKTLMLPSDGRTTLKLKRSNTTLKASDCLYEADNGQPVLNGDEIMIHIEDPLPTPPPEPLPAPPPDPRGVSPFDRSRGILRSVWSVMSQKEQNSVASAPSGDIPYVSAGIEREDWAKLPYNAQKMAAATGAMRAQLSLVPALSQLDDCLTLSKVVNHGVSVVSSVGDTVVVGHFTVPSTTFDELLGLPKGQPVTML